MGRLVGNHTQEKSGPSENRWLQNNVPERTEPPASSSSCAVWQGAANNVAGDGDLRYSATKRRRGAATGTTRCCLDKEDDEKEAEQSCTATPGRLVRLNRRVHSFPNHRLPSSLQQNQEEALTGNLTHTERETSTRCQPQHATPLNCLLFFALPLFCQLRL